MVYKNRIHIGSSIGPFTHPKHPLKNHSFFFTAFYTTKKTYMKLSVYHNCAHAPLVAALHALALKRGESCDPNRNYSLIF